MRVLAPWLSLLAWSSCTLLAPFGSTAGEPDAPLDSPGADLDAGRPPDLRAEGDGAPPDLLTDLAPPDTTAQPLCRPSGWCWAYPRPQGHTLMAAAAASPTEIYAAGHGGTLIHFDGTRWSTVPPPTTSMITALGVRAGQLWAVTSDGQVLHRDGGGAWHTPADVAEGLMGVRARTATTAFAVGFGGTALRIDGTSWTTIETGTKKVLFDVWSTTAGELFIVGAGGTVIRSDGTVVTSLMSITNAELHGVWGSGASDVFTVGDAGTIARFDGSNWTLVDPPTTGAQLWAVAGDGPAAIHAVGAGGTALFYDGSAWAEVDSGAPATTPPGTTMFLFDVTTTGVDGAAVAVGTLGTIVRRQGGAWSLISSPLRPQLDAVWLADPQHGVAAGSGGTAMHLDGSQWTPRDTGISVNLHGVWGASMTHIFAVGEGGAVVHLDPTGWAAMLPKPTTLPLRAVWGASASEIFAVSESLEYYVCDGTSWTTESFGVPVDQLALNGLWGIGQRRFAVGAGGTILAYDGTAWSEHQSHVGSTLYAVWGRGPSAVFAVGAAGAITDYDGTVWTKRTAATTATLHGVWGDDVEAFAVGNNGKMLVRGPSDWTAIEDVFPQLMAVTAVPTSGGSRFVAVGGVGVILERSP